MKQAADSLGEVIAIEMIKLEQSARCGLTYLPLSLILAFVLIFCVVTL